LLGRRPRKTAAVRARRKASSAPHVKTLNFLELSHLQTLTALKEPTHAFVRVAWQRENCREMRKCADMVELCSKDTRCFSSCPLPFNSAACSKIELGRSVAASAARVGVHRHRVAIVAPSLRIYVGGNRSRPTVFSAPGGMIQMSTRGWCRSTLSRRGRCAP
jgi:hypothetical protein